MLHRVLSHTKLQLIMHMHAWTEIINNCPEPGVHITERASNLYWVWESTPHCLIRRVFKYCV